MVRQSAGRPGFIEKLQEAAGGFLQFFVSRCPWGCRALPRAYFINFRIIPSFFSE